MSVPPETAALAPNAVLTSGSLCVSPLHPTWILIFSHALFRPLHATHQQDIHAVNLDINRSQLSRPVQHNTLRLYPSFTCTLRATSVCPATNSTGNLAQGIQFLLQRMATIQVSPMYTRCSSRNVITGPISIVAASYMAIHRPNTVSGLQISADTSRKLAFCRRNNSVSFESSQIHTVVNVDEGGNSGTCAGYE